MRLKPYAENTRINGNEKKVNIEYFYGIFSIWKDYRKNKEKDQRITLTIEIEDNKIIFSNKE